MTIGRVIEDIQIVQMQVNDRRFVAGAVLVALLAMGVAAANRSKVRAGPLSLLLCG